jgi:hypothetical protein
MTGIAYVLIGIGLAWLIASGLATGLKPGRAQAVCATIACDLRELIEVFRGR